MNVLVTGGCGQLGMSLRRVMADAIFTDVVDAPDTVLLDITDLAAVRSMVASEGGMSGLPMAKLMMSRPSALRRATSFNLRLK